MIYCVHQPKNEDQTLVKIGNTGHRPSILKTAACSQIKSSGLKKKEMLFHFPFPMSFMSTSSGSTQLSLSPERKCGQCCHYSVQSKVASLDDPKFVQSPLRSTDMKFVKHFTSPDFQAKNFTPLISQSFNSFGDKNTNKWVKMEKFTPLA